MGLLRALALFVRSRVESLFAWAWCTAVGCLIQGRGLPALVPSLLSVATVLAICVCVYQYNDAIDSEMDKLNPMKGRRPIPSGEVSVRDAMKLVYVFGAISIALSALLGAFSFALCIGFLVLFLIYSYPPIRVKRMFIFKKMTIAGGYVLTTLIGGAAVGGVPSPHTVFAGIIFSVFVFLAYPGLYDYSDVREDEIYGFKSMAMVLSWNRLIQMVILAILIIMTLTPLTYARLGFNTVFPIAVVGLSLVFLRYLFPIMSKFDERALTVTRKGGFIYFMLVQAAFVVGTLGIQLPF